MYLIFYNLAMEPFHITPDPTFLFLGPSHKEALGSIIYGIEKRKGFVQIIGEVGTGKTTIIRSYLDNADRKTVNPIYVFNSNVSFHDLLRVIFQELAITPAGDSPHDMLQQLHQVLIEKYREGSNTVLIIDEAQNMPVETLESLRMLSNLETTKDKLIQIILVGQPEFDAKLDMQELRQLKQRMAIRARIMPLSRDDSFGYILHRLSLVTPDASGIFSKGAVAEIVARANGNPRVMNILCDNALIAGYGYQKRPITRKIAREVIADFDGKARKALNWRLFFTTTIATCAVFAAIIFAMFQWQLSSPHTRALSHAEFRGKAITASNGVKVLGTAPAANTPAIPAANTPAIPADRAEDSAVAASLVSLPPDRKEPMPAPAQEPVPAAAAAAAATTAAPAAEPAVIAQMPPQTEASPAPTASPTTAPTPAPTAPPADAPAATQSSAAMAAASPASESAPAKGKATENFPVTLVIASGDHLTKLCLSVYGTAGPREFEKVRMSNPRIRDINTIMTGETIVFPAP